MKLADTAIDQVFGKISPPEQIKPLTDLGGAGGISQVLSSMVEIIYIVASIVFVFMVVISAFQWIISGGDKEAVGNARKRLTYAIIGIAMLALAFVILKAIGDITGFHFFTPPPGSSMDYFFQNPQNWNTP
ncbi:hypothetical protein HY385_01430 [Candidatus Daviesbacteria bacterium]|nr:hypothetical protein [Candidatus Daviesbacteria bacterium]